ncbi:hypothetical protein [Streptomyces sp.]|uniref:hypothetical protein n=1 Tax=Streptomyces sp. TaxID=1931 RepID=UPI002D76EF41|nr:hypothetical protein [Streptomyces sp.]HET6354862.1 hypothetical protein [Streptomyces sp.]
MTTTSAMPKAKKRQTRTRTKRVSHRPALAVSKLLPTEIDLLPGTESLVCPDCETWCPITGHDGLNPKLVPHHAGRAEQAEARRCSGSNRLVLLDLTIPEWHHLLADAIKETSSRRATNVLRKPQTAVAPAATQIKPVPLSADAAHKAYRTHLKQCLTCTGRTRCMDGKRLAATYARLERQQPKRDRVRAVLARERVRFDRRYAAEAAQKVAAELTKQQEATTDAKKLTKRSGTSVEEANNRCRPTPKDVLSEFRGAEVPLEPLRITV